MFKGKCLNFNSTIGIVAPSSPENKDIINKKITNFSSLGFKIKTASHLYSKLGHLAGSDKDRAEDIMNMFLDPDVDGIICFRGGYGSIRTLPYINPSIIRKNPKFFCGFSDITILLNYFSSIGLITFHGPMINSDFSDELTKRFLLDICTYSNKDYTYNLNDFNTIEMINKKSFNGKLVGGNLAMICSAIGTPYEIDLNNSILLIEEINEYPYAIDRMLTELLFNKNFKKCNGIIIGSFTGCNLDNYDSSFTIEEVFLDRLYNLGIPIIKGFPFGHSYPNITIPIGCKAHFNSNNMTLKIEDNFLL